MNTLPRIAGVSAGLLLASFVQAQSLLFDFGPTAATAAAAKTNSPGHASGAVVATDTRWNQVQTADVASGLRFGDDSTADGVAIDIGVETTSTSNIIDFSVQPTSTLQGSNGSYSTGIYNPSDSPARDFIFNSFNNEPWAIGVKVTGLAAGVYNVYVSGANTNAAAAGTMNFFASPVAGGATSFDFAALTGASATNLSSGAATWTEGVNYVVFSVSITSGDALALAASGTGASSGGRGFLNSLEVVRVGNIPEPGAFAGVAGAAALAAVMVGRRRRA